MEIVTGVLIIVGGGFCAIAAIGILRMPDIYIRMHAATKAGTLGAGLILAAVAVHFGGGVVLKSLAAIVFLIVTAPVAAHLLGRAAYRSGVPLWEGSVADELRSQSAPRMGEGVPAQRMGEGVPAQRMSEDGSKQRRET